jgi:hypothetical protein
MKPNLSLLLAIFLTACGTPPIKTVHIDSQPRGARVFFGAGAQESDAEKTRQFLGVTPFDWQTQGDGDGRFKNTGGVLIYSTFVPPAFVFFADPPSDATNLFAKRQVFHGGALVTPPDKIPEGVFFDLTKPGK